MEFWFRVFMHSTCDAESKRVCVCVCVWRSDQLKWHSVMEFGLYSVLKTQIRETFSLSNLTIQAILQSDLGIKMKRMCYDSLCSILILFRNKIIIHYFVVDALKLCVNACDWELNTRFIIKEGSSRVTGCLTVLAFHTGSTQEPLKDAQWKEPTSARWSLYVDIYHNLV